MIAGTINILQCKPLSNIMGSITVRTMFSEYLEVTLSAPIDRQVDKLSEIITA